MTDSPPPSGRPETAKMAAFVLLRPLLFAIGAIGLTLGLLVLMHRPSQQGAPSVAQAPGAPPVVVLPDPDPVPPISATDFQGFQMKPGAQQTDADPPASDRYELALRLEKGDTIDKMLAAIQFDDYLALEANEVDDELPDGS